MGQTVYIIAQAIDLQTDLGNLSNCCVDNEIYINSEKLKVMFFGSKSRIESSTLPDFYIGGTTLQKSQNLHTPRY